MRSWRRDALVPHPPTGASGASGRMQRSCRCAGFTLVELLAVTMVMAILAGIVLGVAGYAARRADESRAKAELQVIRNALDGYRVTAGMYPQVDLTTTGQWDSVAADLTNHVESITFVDPWGRPYQYITQGRFSFDLYSTGPTGPDQTYDIIR